LYRLLAILCLPLLAGLAGRRLPGIGGGRSGRRGGRCLLLSFSRGLWLGCRFLRLGRWSCGIWLLRKGWRAYDQGAYSRKADA
jgi:hypothetical protein